MTSRGRTGRLAVTLLAFSALFYAAEAAELTVGWAAANDDATAGYDLEVLDQEGTLLFTLNAGEGTRVVVTGLADGVVYTFRVRPYDEQGNRARKPSSVLVTSPKPRVDSVTGMTLVEGSPARMEVRGANFLPGARVLSRREGVRVLSQQVVSHDLLFMEVLASPGAGLVPADLLVVNPVRKTEDYVRTHPEVLDLDSSGAIDEIDQELVQAAFGRRAGEAGYQAALDPNGDGVIDGEDLALIKALTGREVFARGGGP